MNLSRVTRTRYRTKRDEPGGVRKLSKCKKIYPRLAANGARVATRGAREGQKLHILPFITGITCSKSTRVFENKICTENNELIYMGVFPRRRASPRAARAPTRCGVDQTFDHARSCLGWSSTTPSEPRRVRPLHGEGHVNSWSRIGRV